MVEPQKSLRSDKTSSLMNQSSFEEMDNKVVKFQSPYQIEEDEEA